LHPIGESPHHLLAHDLRLVTLADDLGFDEFWVGEHHSGGWGLISSPELFLARAAGETSRITLATGVVSLPYHHPFLVAERARLLDHLTRGRFVLGVGAGSVPGDMAILNVDPADARRRTRESLEVIVELLRGECVTREADWFSVREGRIQLPPFSRNDVELVISSAATPFGVEQAGRLGISALSYAASPWGVVRPGQGMGVGVLGDQWQRLENAAEAAGRTADRNNWRISVPVHVSTSREAAAEELFDGWQRQRRELWINTMGMPMSRLPEADRKAFEATIEADGIILGSPEECAAGVVRLAKNAGGFGCLLLSLQDWADRDAQERSLELFVRFVVPQLVGSLDPVRASNSWAAQQRSVFQAANAAAKEKALSAAATGGPA
jgi:limonene 1,2-monooxygenase